jgi:N-acetylglucosamine kinase-like BadF-type ATPase
MTRKGIVLAGGSGSADMVVGAHAGYVKTGLQHPVGEAQSANSLAPDVLAQDFQATAD